MKVASPNHTRSFRVLLSQPPVKSLIRYAKRHEWPTISDAQQRFLQASPQHRKVALQHLIASGNKLGIFLFLESGPDFLPTFSQPERHQIWCEILRRELISNVTHHLKPTQQKAKDYLRAVLATEGKTSKSEHVANLMSFLTWDEIPQEIKEHYIFSGMVNDPIKQRIISAVRNKAGESNDIGQREVCSDMERSMTAAIKGGQVILVNNHMLFKKTPQINVALCLRSFISSSGYVFLKGMYYHSSERVAILGQKGKRLLIEDAFWMPNRFCQPVNHQPHFGQKTFDLGHFSKMFPPGK